MDAPQQLRDAVRGLHENEAGLLRRTSLFDLLADDVEWEVLGSPSELPWAGVFSGPEGVRRWLEVLDAHLAYEQFEPLEFFADGQTVIEVVAASGHARATPRPFASEVVRLWTFRGGRAVRVRSFYDTLAYERALHGSPDA